jgi:hypothetical protein
MSLLLLLYNDLRYIKPNILFSYGINELDLYRYSIISV